MSLTALDRTQEAREIFDELIAQSRRQVVPPFILAWGHLALGESDRGFEWLETGYRERDDNLTFLKVDPAFDLFRSDPRFQSLLRRMNFLE